MLLTVVIPVYNVEGYLSNCIDCLTKQTYKEFRVILIDDGSTDASGSICDAYRNTYDFIDVVHKKNGGLSNTRNLGLKMCKTKYIYFLDSDDTVHPELFETTISIMEKFELDLIGFEANVIDDNRIEKLKQNTSVYMEKMQGIESAKEHVPVSTVPLYLYKTTFLQDNNIFFWESIYYEDMDFVVKLFLHNPKVIYLDSLFYNYYRRDGSITSSISLKKYNDICDICEYYVKEYKYASEVQKNFLNTVFKSYFLVMFERYKELSYEDNRLAKKRLWILKKTCIIEKISLVPKVEMVFLPLIYIVREFLRMKKTRGVKNEN